MAQTALVFGMDRRGHVRHSRELRFTSLSDLVRQLAPDFAEHPLIEVWNGAVCVFRNGRPSPLDPDESDAL